MTTYLQDTPETIKIHLYITRKNLRSTTKATENNSNTHHDDIHPYQDPKVPCELFCFVTLSETHINTLYTGIIIDLLLHQFVFKA